MSDEPDGDIDAHLSDLDDGCGCVEMWTHTSEKRTTDEQPSGGTEKSEATAE